MLRGQSRIINRHARTAEEVRNMPTVAHVLENKGGDLITVEKGSTVFDAISVMDSNHIGALIITSNGEIAGIFTERDYLGKIALKFRSSRETLVEEVMTADVVVGNSGDSIERCMRLMTRHKCRHLPIIGDDGIAGMISLGDLVSHMLDEKQAEVDQLSSYIQGSY
jgi:CBS domain-containing protein